MARRTRAMLVLGALAHCAARELADRRLITFDEARAAIPDAVPKTADKAMNSRTTRVATLPTRDSDDESKKLRSPSAALLMTIGTASTSRTDEKVTEKRTTMTEDEERSLDDEDEAINLTKTVADRQRTSSGEVRTVKRLVTKDSTTDDEARADYRARKRTVPPTALASTRSRMPAIPIAAQRLVPVSISTQTSSVTSVPPPVTEASTTEALAYAPVSVTQSGAPLQDNGLLDGTATPPVAASPVVASPPGDTVLVPAATPTAQIGETKPLPDIRFIDENDGAAKPPSTTTAPPSSKTYDDGEQSILGQIHASSSADVSSNKSPETTDTESLDPSGSQGGSSTKKQTKKETTSSNRDPNGDCNPSCVNGDSREKPSHSDANRDNKDSSASGLRPIVNPGDASGVNTSSAAYYSLGTGSIVAVVGVIAGIMGLVVLFVAIGRKSYTNEDDESPLPCGYNMGMRRLSPTFLDDESLENGYNGTTLMTAASSYEVDSGSSTGGESLDEVRSLRTHMVATNDSDHLGDNSCRTPSMHGISGDVDTANIRMSALYSSGSSVTSGSAISGSWSSVLASDTDYRTSRNTRDTSFSSWSASNLSPFGSSGVSGMNRPSSRSS